MDFVGWADSDVEGSCLFHPNLLTLLSCSHYWSEELLKSENEKILLVMQCRERQGGNYILG